MLSDWYWLHADGRLYSSAAEDLVGEEDEAYLAWLERGNQPTHWPTDEAGEQTDAELAKVLAAHGLAVYGDRRSLLPPLSPRQLRLMMLSLDLSEEAVQAKIALIQDAAERAAALIEWQWAATYQRTHPLAVEIAAALEFDPVEFDALWEYAAEL